MGQSLSHRKRVTDEQVENARGLRQAGTPAEDALWQALRGRKLDGLKFRRQQPVAGFVVDFFCEAKDLAIELDGDVHNDPGAAAADQERQSILEAHGLRFLRFKNHEVLGDLPSVLARILST